MTQYLKILEDKINNFINQFQEEITSLRTSRPSSSLVENIKVFCYNTETPLKHLASISVVLPNIIIIEPWDASIIKDIEKAIANSNLGLTPTIEGKQLKLFLPSLTKERKEALIKILNSLKEDTRIKIRKAREETIEEIKQDFGEKKISEDDKFKLLEEVQRIIDKYNKILEEKTEKKSQEIMES
ncbi:MAG: ribosome recycling factor [Minisyncoccia bacterium]|jgi:ribosome recycling factor